jgi:hypothetical protein
VTAVLEPQVVLFEAGGRYHRGELVGFHIRSCHEVDMRSEIVVGALDDCSPECLCPVCFPDQRLPEDEALR